MRRLILASILLVAVMVAAGAGPTLAGGSPGPVCCICQCAGAAVQCLDAANPDACGPFLNGCGEDNSTCRTGTTGGNCSALPQCTSAPAPAPTLGASGLAAGITLLSALALWRLRSPSKL
jgi:hypothetical protein